ncbi:MAG: hypothetical protein PF442_02575 [Desulfobulbaceae bacterium]|jgi:hypothetical protein|nr:hypothetical protein [Desulfobulbaceae bacterium]
MKTALKQLLTLASLLSLMQMSWWGCWIDDADYQFGVDMQRLVGQQITSENTPQEDLHFLEKEKVAPPLAANE